MKEIEELDYAIVAFIDILGFSEMVQADCENYRTEMKYFTILRQLNDETKKIEECEVTQFSDSVIFSLPLNCENYKKMLEAILNYQYKLLLENIICRGAISFGKHYKKNDFMFSQALIEAYRLESREAIYPRVILSNNLVDYFSTYNVDDKKYLIKERDGFSFIDYMLYADKNCTYEILKKFAEKLPSYSSQVKEKYYWLFRYWEYSFSQKLDFNSNIFEKIE